MFHFKKGMAYKTNADSTSLYADAPANTLLNHVFCYFVHHLSKFQNMHPFRIAADYGERGAGGGARPDVAAGPGGSITLVMEGRGGG